MSGSQTRLTYNGQEEDGYRRGPEDVPALPTQTVNTDFGVMLVVHAPAEPARFSVLPAALAGTSAEPSTPDEAARAFVEDLIQLDRLDLRAAHGSMSLIAPSDSRSRKTHIVRETSEGLVLKRLHFDCGFHSHS
jgi:hypothetical protein